MFYHQTTIFRPNISKFYYMVIIDYFIFSFIRQKKSTSFLTRRATREKRTIPASKSDQNWPMACEQRAGHVFHLFQSVWLCFFCACFTSYYVDFWYYMICSLNVSTLIFYNIFVIHILNKITYICIQYHKNRQKCKKCNDRSKLVRSSCPRRIEIDQWRALFTLALGRSRVPSISFSNLSFRECFQHRISYHFFVKIPF